MRANALVSAIHDRMPVILRPDDDDCWLGKFEPDPRALLVPYPAERMAMWLSSTGVISPPNEDADMLTPLARLAVLV